MAYHSRKGGCSSRTSGRSVSQLIAWPAAQKRYTSSAAGYRSSVVGGRREIGTGGERRSRERFSRASSLCASDYREPSCLLVDGCRRRCAVNAHCLDDSWSPVATLHYPDGSNRIGKAWQPHDAKTGSMAATLIVMMAAARASSGGPGCSAARRGGRSATRSCRPGGTDDDHAEKRGHGHHRGERCRPSSVDGGVLNPAPPSERPLPTARAPRPRGELGRRFDRGSRSPPRDGDSPRKPGLAGRRPLSPGRRDALRARWLRRLCGTTVHRMGRLPTDRVALARAALSDRPRTADGRSSLVRLK